MKLSRFLQLILGVMTLSLVVFLGAKTRNALQEYRTIGTIAHERDTIAIDGTGKVSAKPDIALLNLGVLSEGKTVKDAQSQNTEKMNAILAALRALDIESKDLQTSNYTVSPKYDWSNNRQSIIGYTVNQNVTVKVRNLDRAGDVLAKAGELGMNETGGIQFTIDDPQKLQAEARVKAIEQARVKAEQLAQTLGLKIVRVVTFSEDQGIPTPIAVPMMRMMDAAVASAPAPVPEVQSGSLDVSSHVVVTFEVQ